jgi:hypothetical protein
LFPAAVVTPVTAALWRWTGGSQIGRRPADHATTTAGSTSITAGQRRGACRALLHELRGDFRLAVGAGLVEGRPAALVYAPNGSLAYFVALTWHAGKLAGIRDFRYARYIMEAVWPVAL